MKKLAEFVREQPVTILLIALPFAILGEIGNWGEMWVFVLSSIAIIPLAGLIGSSTEALTAYTGPRVGGLLNATLGNAAELIITIVAIREGLLELVKASITGSILGNILLVMGMSMLLGGLRNGIQRFDSRHASRSAILLMLSVIALLVPSVLSSSIGPTDSLKVEALSLGVAVIMIILYAAALFFSFRDRNGMVTEALTGERSHGRMAVESSPDLKKEHSVITAKPTTAQVVHHPSWSLRTSLILLALSTLGVVVMSELLVGVVEPVVAGLGVSEFFLGIILIPLIGNVAEHLVAVKVAIQNQMELSVEIAVASSLQIALFVAPVLVFISLLMGNPLQLIFNEFELLALIVGVLITVLISMDGESNWLEGAELLAVYLILALAFFLLPV
jgi:Ca2+:H+ antiporter